MVTRPWVVVDLHSLAALWSNGVHFSERLNFCIQLMNFYIFNCFMLVMYMTFFCDILAFFYKGILIYGFAHFLE